MRMLTYTDLEVSSGKVQLSYTGALNMLQYNMNQSMEKVIASLWIAVFEAETKGPTVYNEQFENEVLDYIGLTKLNTSFDLDGNFLVPIPQSIAQFYTSSPLPHGPMWTPLQTAAKQRT